MDKLKPIMNEVKLEIKVPPLANPLAAVPILMSHAEDMDSAGRFDEAGKLRMIASHIGFAEEERRVFCAHMEALHKVREWKPISEAPKDGTPILLYCGDDSDYEYVAILFFSKDEWIDLEGREWDGNPPTHFMYLPSAPLTRPGVEQAVGDGDV